MKDTLRLREEWKKFNGDQIGDEVIADYWIDILEQERKEWKEKVQKNGDEFNGYDHYHDAREAEIISEGYRIATDHFLALIQDHGTKERNNTLE